MLVNTSEGVTVTIQLNCVNIYHMSRDMTKPTLASGIYKQQNDLIF